MRHGGEASCLLPSVPTTVGPKHPLPHHRPLLPSHPHLHSLLRGQQLLLFFCYLEDEAWVALHCLAIFWRPGRGQPPPPGVGSSLAEAQTWGPTLKLSVSSLPSPKPPPPNLLPRNSLPPPLPASPVLGDHQAW